MTQRTPIPVLFHPRQLEHKPLYEWAFGEKLAHPETTDRADRIFAALSADSALFSIRPPTEIPLALLQRVHDARLITLYQHAAEALPAGKTLHPSVFPKRSQARGDPLHLGEAGYFCFDSGTPLCSTTWDAAAWSAACACEAARLVASGDAPLAYGLCRPPGHHASRDLFGGYCYFNNAALAARILRRSGTVALLDIDFHHGNGTQSLFYRDARVLFASIHGDPREFYPYFSGYQRETGEGPGRGFTLNYPLPRGCDMQGYLEVLDEGVLPAIRAFAPAFLVISAGLDTYREDPIGAFTLDTPDYHAIGERLGRLGLPTLAIQEGGYCVERLGENVATLLRGLADGLAAAGARGAIPAPSPRSAPGSPPAPPPQASPAGSPPTPRPPSPAG